MESDGDVELGADGYATLEYVGTISERLSLADNTLTDSATNFRRADDQSAAAGSLDLDAAIDRAIDVQTNFGVDGTLNGTLTTANDVDIALAFDVDAQLYRDGGAAVVAYSNGTNTINGNAIAYVAQFVLEGK